MPIGDWLPSLRLNSIFDPSANQTPDNTTTDQLTQALLDRLNQPDPNLDRLTQLYNQFPQRTNPSFLRRLGAGVIGAGYGPKAAQEFVDEPFNKQLQDWAAKRDTAKTIADLDIKNQRDEMTGAVRGIQTQIAIEKQQGTFEYEMQKLQNQMELKQKDIQMLEMKLEQDRNNHELQNQYLTLRDSLKDDQHKADMLQKENEYQQRLGLLQNQLNRKGWTLGAIDDPSDPTKKITVRINQDTGETQRIKLDDQEIGPITKPGTSTKSPADVTNQTKTMMEGAQMLRPHIEELRQQAIALNKRGLFGPIMSRVRDLAAKVGTTGDANDVAKGFGDFATSLNTDPYLNQSKDAAVGQFLTTLGLMASGAGRVHGNARGGGSIQMINYMKSLLTSDSTLGMFNGRLNGLDSFMKGYAAGPGATPKTKTKLDQALEEILKGVK